MSQQKVRLTRPKIALIAAAAVVLLVIATGIVWIVTRADAEPAAARFVPDVEPRPVAVDLATAVPIEGTIDGWTQAGETDVARVIPAVGAAADGDIAAYVSTQRDGDEVTALSAALAVEAGTSVTVSFQARVQSELPVAVPAWVQLGADRIAIPDLSAEWTTVTATIELTEAVSAFALMLDGVVDGLSIDDVSVTASDAGENLIGNGSFESVQTSAKLLNRSLIMPASRAAIAVRMGSGEATWSVVAGEDAVVAEGTEALGDGPHLIDLGDVPQGYYNVTVTDAAGASVTAPIAVIDYSGESIAKDYRIGVGLHVENDYYEDAADALSSVGAGLARNDILWRFNETTKGQYDWDERYTTGFDHLASHGVHLLGIVNYGNALYGSVKVPSGAAALTAYGNYAAAIAERFDLVGLEVFNEFNHERFNDTACGTGPECYVPLIQAVHDAVDPIDPELPIIAGSTARYPDDWFAGLWQDGALDIADAVSYHPYEVMYEPHRMSEIIAQSVETMQANGGKTLPVWISEMGTSSKPGLMSQSGQATNLLVASLTALGSGAEKFFWYDLVNDDTDVTVFEGNFGLFAQMKADVAAYPPKPAAFAMALLTNQIGGHEVAEASVEHTDDTVVYAFGDEGDRVYTAWSTTGEGTVSIPADGPVEVVTSTGETALLTPTDGAVEVTLTSAPSFVRLGEAVGPGE